MTYGANKMSKLDAGQKHLLRLLDKDAGAGGWAPVSSLVWPFVASLPDDLVEKRPSDGGGHARLTPSGNAIRLYA